MDNKVEELRRRLGAELEATRRKSQQVKETVLDRINDPLGHYIDRINDIEFLPDGRINPATITRAIFRYKDSEGRTIHTTETGIPLNQMRSLRDKIIAQKSAFDSLDDQQRRQIQEGLKQDPVSPLAKPYVDLLRSEALGVRFDQLKTNPLRPFGKK